MARGINKQEDRKVVKSKSIAIRFNQYELDSIDKHLNNIGWDKGISTFIREVVISHTTPTKVS
jgi:hypothetical protein